MEDNPSFTVGPFTVEYVRSHVGFDIGIMWEPSVSDSAIGTTEARLQLGLGRLSLLITRTDWEGRLSTDETTEDK